MIDLTGKVLQGKYPLLIRNTDTYEGGDVSGPVGYDDNTAWSAWHDTTGVVVQSPNCIIQDTDIHNVGDGISLSSRVSSSGEVRTSDNTAIKNVSILSAHDDALEDDEMRSMNVSNSRIEGMVFLSTMSPGGVSDGTGHLISISDTIARLRPYYNSYKPDKYGYNQHGGIFKTPLGSGVGLGDGKSGIPPKIELTNCFFFASMTPKYGGNLGCPPNVSGDKITLCWEGDGVWPQKYVDEWRLRCTNVTVMSNKNYWAWCSAIWKHLYRQPVV